MGRRGRKRQLVVEDEYWALVMDGMGTVEACRQVGIGRNDGLPLPRRARGLPPLRLPEAERGDRYLSLVESKRIATLRERGGVREIAPRVFTCRSHGPYRSRGRLSGCDRPGGDGGGLTMPRRRAGDRPVIGPRAARSDVARRVAQRSSTAVGSWRTWVGATAQARFDGTTMSSASGHRPRPFITAGDSSRTGRSSTCRRVANAGDYYVAVGDHCLRGTGPADQDPAEPEILGSPYGQSTAAADTCRRQS